MILSIIIPTYNRQALIKYALDSLDKKYHPGIDYEVLVIDDGSTDDTAKIVGTYNGIQFVNNAGKGASAARNTGLGLAKGKYICYLDSDDLIGPAFFTEKIKILECDNGLGAVYGRYEYFTSDDVFSPEKIAFKHKYPLLSEQGQEATHLINYLNGNFISPNAIVWRKEFLVANNGHDDTLIVNQDVDLFIRGLFNNLRLVSVDDDTYAYIRNHNIDVRVGNPANQEKKFEQILALRKKIVSQLKEGIYNDAPYYKAISTYLFNHWRVLRHRNKELADKFLSTAKETYWPVELNGHLFYRIFSKITGPVNAVKLKSLIFKRD